MFPNAPCFNPDMMTTLAPPPPPLGFPMSLPPGVQPRRKNATRESTKVLKQWLNSRSKNPYPTKSEKIFLAVITCMSLIQISTWFANARRRLKKENKMTWEPRNRCDEDDDDDDEKDEDDCCNSNQMDEPVQKHTQQQLPLPPQQHQQQETLQQIHQLHLLQQLQIINQQPAVPHQTTAFSPFQTHHPLYQIMAAHMQQQQHLSQMQLVNQRNVKEIEVDVESRKSLRDNNASDPNLWRPF